MRRPQLTIASMLGIVAVAAVGIVAFQTATDAALTVVINGVVLILIYATVEAKFSQGSTAAWWFGFALFGWVALLCSEANLSTTKIFGWLMVLVEPTYFLDDSPGIQRWICRYGMARALFSLVVGLGGAILVAWYAGKRERRQSSEFKHH